VSGLPIRRRILGVDFGRVRIGIAISDELGLLAHPVRTVPASREAAKQIAQIVREKDVERVVIGLPRQMSGRIGEAAAETLAFADKLRKLLRCEVVTWDERLTTVAANRALRDGGHKTRDSRKVVDQVAAQMILQGYLDGLQSAHGQRDSERELRHDN
jgi:putative holliday junction resolvase